MTTPVIPPAIDDSTSLIPKKMARARPLFDPELLRRAIGASFGKLNPVTLMKNPVIFVVEVGAALTTAFLIRDLVTGAADLYLAVVHRAVRYLRRGHGRSPR